MEGASWLRGNPQAPAPQGPQGMPQGGGTRPALKQIVMAGLDSQAPSLTFVFADGFRATETPAELGQMGVDTKALQALDAVFTHMGDTVYTVAKGGGQGGQMLGQGGMPPAAPPGMGR